MCRWTECARSWRASARTEPQQSRPRVPGAAAPGGLSNRGARPRGGERGADQPGCRVRPPLACAGTAAPGGPDPAPDPRAPGASRRGGCRNPCSAGSWGRALMIRSGCGPPGPDGTAGDRRRTPGTAPAASAAVPQCRGRLPGRERSDDEDHPAANLPVTGPGPAARLRGGRRGGRPHPPVRAAVGQWGSRIMPLASGD